MQFVHSTTAFTTLLAKDTKSAIQQGDRKGSPWMRVHSSSSRIRQQSLLLMSLEIATAASTASATKVSSTSTATTKVSAASSAEITASTSSKVAACPAAEVSTTRGILTLIPALLARFIFAVLFA